MPKPGAQCLLLFDVQFVLPLSRWPHCPALFLFFSVTQFGQLLLFHSVRIGRSFVGPPRSLGLVGLLTRTCIHALHKTFNLTRNKCVHEFEAKSFVSYIRWSVGFSSLFHRWWQPYRPHVHLLFISHSSTLVPSTMFRFRYIRLKIIFSVR